MFLKEVYSLQYLSFHCCQDECKLYVSHKDINKSWRHGVMFGDCSQLTLYSYTPSSTGAKAVSSQQSEF